MECPSCGKVNDESFTHCEECQTELKEYFFCPNCGEKIETKSKVCPYCMFIFSIELRPKIKPKINLPEPEKIKMAPPKTLKCQKCNRINNPMNIYCEGCRTLLVQNRKCPNCGATHDLGFFYCTECGTDLITKTHHITTTSPKYKKACYILGITGSVLGAIIFLIALTLTIDYISHDNFCSRLLKNVFGFSYTFGDVLREYSSNIYPLVLSPIAFILGFIGVTRVKDSIKSGSIHLIVGAIFSILCVFAPQWYIATPGILLLIAGILSLFKTNTVETIRVKC